MAPIPKGGTVAVTGSAGFIGGWVVRRLLDKGYRVRACVRDANNAARTDFLKAMPGYASGRLTLHSADLDNPGSFDDIFAGCHGVAHVAHVSDYSDHEYVRMVCDHLIESVNKARSVSRVVVTSSIAAVISESDMNEFVRRPGALRGPLPGRAQPEAHARPPGLFDGQDHRPAGVLGRRRAERRLGCRHLLPGRQRWADPVGAPEEHGPLAAQHRDDAARRVLPERRLPTVDDRRRARRRRLPHRAPRERARQERRALHRLVDGHAEGRGDLRQHRPATCPNSVTTRRR